MEDKVKCHELLEGIFDFSAERHLFFSGIFGFGGFLEGDGGGEARVVDFFRS